METCQHDGNPDMYGLGIRLGFYLQWLSLNLAVTLRVHEEIPAIRFTNTSFIAAEFLAVLIQISQATIEPVDIYIVLLLCYGAFLFLAPLYIWRIVTGFEPSLDPTRWPVVEPGILDTQLHYLLLIAVSSFQIWFWAVPADTRTANDCATYAFIFAKIPLENKAFRAVNISLYSCLLILAALSYISLARFFKSATAEDANESDTESYLSGTEFGFGDTGLRVGGGATEDRVSVDGTESTCSNDDKGRPRYHLSP
ncbi:hypothetical protein JDV02_005439 [Purpureocillium takamizusanense]|uniref:Uncharacterized protein n=1 Tax=Purpureocillium takamizusanense TaxID=2060973 RepID=A0A9Q8QHA9_9HYPO|nr:uncharacterized protein JDV02_005439 [Purpureocillium takamizusanense]UNI19242.1 hypothetical protein JDV02_005439 [Purpureocillium takamizusanense]